MASFFEAHLEDLVTRHPSPLRIIYTSNLTNSSPRTLTNETPEDNSDIQDLPTSPPIDTLELTVLSPVFFARFMHYTTSTEAFDHECVFTDEKNRTLWLSRPDLMNELLKTVESSSEIEPASNKIPASAPGFLQWLRWKIHGLLRCLPSSPAYPSSGSAQPLRSLKRATLSPLDRFVGERMPAKANEYRLLCARLYLAQRLAVGFVEVIDLEDMIFRIVIIWRGLNVLQEGSGVHTWRAWMRIAGVHVWALAKGR